MIGQNVDYRHWTDLEALCADLAAHNVKSVRTVLLPTDSRTAWPRACHRAGLTLCSALALESLAGFTNVTEAIDYYSQYEWDILQTGNEFDIDCSGEEECASWGQSDDEVNEILETAYYANPDRLIITPSSATGNPAVFDTISTVFAKGIAAHFYVINSPEHLDQLIGMYAAYGPLYVTEFPQVEYVRQINDDPRVVGGWHFCWSTRMHRDHGIREHPAKLAQFTEGAFTVAAPQFILGFADYAAVHPEVGEPMTNQFTDRIYTDDLEHKSHTITKQETTTGTLFYYQESNSTKFVPKG